MSFLPNLDALQTISRRVQADAGKAAQARQILHDVLADLNAIPADFAPQLATIDSDVAASVATKDPVELQTAGITTLAKNSGENDRTALIAKVTAAIAAL
jgi:hypothetical protein